MADQKKTFIMYTDWDDMIEEMDDIGRSELLLAIMRFQIGKDIPENMSPSARVVFAHIKNQFCKDAEKYQETIQKRAEAGRNGGVKSGEVRAKNIKANEANASNVKQNEANEANASTAKQSEAKRSKTKQNEPDNDNVNVNDNDNVNVNDNVNDSTTPLPPASVGNGADKTPATKSERTMRYFKDHLAEHDFSELITETLNDWLKYKIEKKQPYEEIGIKKLLNKVDRMAQEYGDNAVADVIDDAISNGYKGIIWDKLERGGNSPNSYMNAITNRVKVVDDWI